ncbi:MAG: PIN domain-containing protein [Myxococcaceae bacterium]
MIVLDTNLLIYAHRSETKENLSAQQAIENALEQNRCAVALSSVTEFWSVVTNALPGKRTSTPEEAGNFINQLVQDAPLSILTPTIGFHQRLMELAKRLNICGVGIFDLQIALLALENKATEIWTHDKNFIRVSGLKVYDPIV